MKRRLFSLGCCAMLLLTAIFTSCKTDVPTAENSVAPKVTYTVTFEANGHGTAPDKISDISAGAKITKPEDLAAKGWIFGGWYKEKECKTAWDFDKATVQDDVTLYARWATIGDILLNDGSIVSSASIREEQKGKAVAVVFGSNANGKLLGLGLKQSDSELKWAPNGTKGFATEFTEIICTPSVSNKAGAADTATFTGDTDGSDNWSVICGVDPTGTATDVVASNYPAFNWVNNYGTTYSLPEGYKDGWYMPSIAELAELYKNKTTVNAALTAVGGTELNSCYWSGSQRGSYYYSVWRLSFSDGNIYNNGYKGYDTYVCCVRAF